MFKFITIFVLAMAMIFCVVGCGDDTSTNPVTIREVKASGHPEWPPFMSSTNQINMVGAAVEYNQLIFGDLGLTINPSYQGNWQEVLDKAKTGEIPIVVAAYYTKERSEYMDYSKPICTDPVSLFVTSDSVVLYQNWESLKGLRLVATVGDSYGEEFDNYIISQNLDVTRVNTVAEAFEHVQSKKADGFVYSNYAGRKYIHDFSGENQYKALSPDITVQWFYICISKKSDLVTRMSEVNVLIEKYKNDGTIQKIVNKYINDMLK